MSDQKISPKKKLVAILSDLKTANIPKTKTLLDSLQISGDYTIIEPLFSILLECTDNEKSELITEFLCSLKDSKSAIMVMDCLQQTRFQPIQVSILATIWNSPIDYSTYLSDFVKLAVEQDFLVTLECLTIIENLDGPFEEQALFESQLHLKNYHDGQFLKTKEKDQLISEIALLIKGFDRNTLD